MKKTHIIFVFLFLAILSMVFGVFLSRRQSRTTATCLECHAQMLEDDKLSEKARGKTELIFFHSTHSYSQKNLNCVDCHTQDPHAGVRPAESYCLSCHTGESNKASNECMLCHANAEKLEL